MRIRLEYLTKQFKSVTAVKDMNLLVDDGEMICLLGPSGCGKSTTLAMIAGLEPPTFGEVFFNDQRVTDAAPQDRDIGMVFQNYALYPHMTVAENIMFPLKMQWLPPKKRVEKLKKLAEMMHFDELLNRRPSQLSGGQQQRVAIARALIKEPKLLLMDEPFSNLDARLRIELRDEIRSLQKSLKITTIFVTHDQEEAMSISDRILLLKNGEIQQYSSPQEMYHKPANLFVASFMGNPPINLLPARWDGHSVSLDQPEQWNLHDLKPIGQPFAGQKAILGIRPEDLYVVPSRGRIKSVVLSIQTLGKDVFLKVQAGTHIITACIDWEQQYKVGEELDLDVRKSYIFPDEGFEELKEDRP